LPTLAARFGVVPHEEELSQDDREHLPLREALAHGGTHLPNGLPPHFGNVRLDGESEYAEALRQRSGCFIFLERPEERHGGDSGAAGRFGKRRHWQFRLPAGSPTRRDVVALRVSFRTRLLVSKRRPWQSRTLAGGEVDSFRQGSAMKETPHVRACVPEMSPEVDFVFETPQRHAASAAQPGFDRQRRGHRPEQDRLPPRQTRGEELTPERGQRAKRAAQGEKAIEGTRRQAEAIECVLFERREPLVAVATVKSYEWQMLCKVHLPP